MFRYLALLSAGVSDGTRRSQPAWEGLRRLRHRGHLVVRALALALVLGATVGGGVAQAGTDSFCNQSVAAGATCLGPTHSLTAARGWNNNGGAGCGGALGYAQYFCATPAGCHTYTGLTLLSPGIRHRSSTAKSMSGYSTWGSTAPPAYCDPGSAYAIVRGPVAEESAYADGIPVLDRPAEDAPAGVANLIKGADPARARRFSTPHGSGWALVDTSTSRLCVVVDDAGTGFGYTCQRLSEARATGSLQSLEDEDGDSADGDVVIALPAEGVDTVSVERRDGTTRAVKVDDGVAVFTLTAKDLAVAVEKSDSAPGSVKAQRMVMATKPAARR